MVLTPMRLQRTTPSRQPLNTFNGQTPQGAFGEGVGRALANVGGNIARVGALVQRRQDKKKDFNTATAYAKFNTETERGLSELQRSYDPATQSYTQEAEGFYQQRARQFLDEQVPPELRDEYELKLAQKGGQVIGESMKFQYNADDSYFVAEIDTEYQQALISVRRNPDAYDEQSEILADMVDDSDLSKQDKIELKRDLRRGLQGAFYEGGVERGVIDPSAIGLGNGGTSTAQLIRSREGFRTSPYYDVNAYRIGYGSDTITRADGSVVKVTPGMQVSRADAERDLERRIVEFENTARGQVGAEGWNALPENIRAPLVSMTYNYGELPNSVVNAIKTGTIEDIAQAVAARAIDNGGVNRDRRLQEAQMILGNTPLPSGEIDSRLDDLSYTDRQQLYNQALNRQQQLVTADQQAQTQAQKQLFETNFSRILNGDGTVDSNVIRQQNLTGQLNASQTKQLLDFYKKEQGARELQTQVNYAMSSGVPLDPSNSDLRKAVDQRAGVFHGNIQQFSDQVRAGDPSAMETGSSLSLTTGIVPPTFAAGLTSLLYSDNPQAIVTSANQIAQISRRQPLGANQAFTSAVQERAGIVATAAELFGQEKANEIASAMIDPDRQQQIVALRDIGFKKFEEATKNRNFSTIASAAGFSADGTFTGAHIAAPLQTAFTADYRNAWVQAYSLSGSEDIADQWANEALTKDWGITDVTGVEALMKYPPEKTTPGWTQMLREQHIRSTLDVDSDAEVQLVGTTQTKTLVAAGKMPTYQAYDLNTFQMITDENGIPKIVDFAIDTAEAQQRIDVSANLEDAQRNLELLDEYLFEARDALVTVDGPFAARNVEDTTTARVEVDNLEARRADVLQQIEQLESQLNE